MAGFQVTPENYLKLVDSAKDLAAHVLTIKRILVDAKLVKEEEYWRFFDLELSKLSRGERARALEAMLGLLSRPR